MKVIKNEGNQMKFIKMKQFLLYDLIVALFSLARTEWADKQSNAQSCPVLAANDNAGTRVPEDSINQTPDQW
jgi:hypothetical protein